MENDRDSSGKEDELTYDSCKWCTRDRSHRGKTSRLILFLNCKSRWFLKESLTQLICFLYMNFIKLLGV